MAGEGRSPDDPSVSAPDVALDHPVLFTLAGRVALERELRQLQAGADDDALLRPAPRDPATTVQGRIARLERVLDRAVTSFPDAHGPSLAAVGTVVTVVDDGRLRRHALVLGPARPAVCGAPELAVDAPLGRALLWRPAGARVAVEDADGTARTVRVVAIDEPPASPSRPGPSGRLRGWLRGR